MIIKYTKIILLFLLFTISVSAYETIPLREGYEGEEVGRAAYLPDSKVKYLTSEEASKYLVTIKDGNLLNHEGREISARGIFVMDSEGKIYFSTQQIAGRFHHSSILAGKPVSAAGEMTVMDGVIIDINKQSGHYKPNFDIHMQVLSELKKRGANSIAIANLKTTDQEVLQSYLENLRIQKQFNHSETDQIIRAYLKINTHWTEEMDTNWKVMQKGDSFSSLYIPRVLEIFSSREFEWTKSKKEALSQVLTHPSSSTLNLIDFAEVFSSVEGQWTQAMKSKWLKILSNGKATDDGFRKLFFYFNEFNDPWSFDKKENFKLILSHPVVKDSSELVNLAFNTFSGEWDEGMILLYKSYLKQYPELKRSNSYKKFKSYTNIAKKMKLGTSRLKCSLNQLIR